MQMMMTMRKMMLRMETGRESATGKRKVLMTPGNRMIKSWPIGSTASLALRRGPVLEEHMCSVCTTATKPISPSISFIPTQQSVT